MAEFNVQIDDHTRELLEAIDTGCLEAFEEIGQIAEGYAKADCPVDTGRLRNSITYEAEDRKVSVGTNVEYAPYVELGMQGRNPQPFIRPSIEEHVNQYGDIIAQNLRSSVN